MDIILMELKLKNFKGVSNFVLETSGKNISIYGQNATGKTTLIDAFMWLLFDKDSTDMKDFTRDSKYYRQSMDWSMKCSGSFIDEKPQFRFIPKNGQEANLISS